MRWLGLGLALWCIGCGGKPQADMPCSNGCVAPPNGTAACVNDSCMVTCDAGFRACSGLCEAESPTSCGATCMQCPLPAHGVATCTDGACGVTCDAGYHECAGQCVAEDATSCGPTCGNCPVPANSTASCDASACEFACNASYHLCGADCVLEDATSCGSACTVCPVPANSTAGCTSGGCDFTCNATYHLCTGQCVHEDVTSCGATCTPCTPPTNSTASCTNGTCGYTCNSGYHACTGQCVVEDASSCGATCMTCATAPTNGAPACVAGSCDYVCNAGYVRCASGCCTVAEVQTHFYFALVHTSGGDYRAWGENSARELADGTTIDRPIPIAAPNIPSDAKAIAVGDDHTCFITATNGAKCFGSNAYGQLGDGTTNAYSATPVDVVGLTSGVTQLSAGYQFTCAVVNGGAKCWGSGDQGILGYGGMTNQRMPADVSGLTSGVSKVIAGWLHTCAITTTGGVKCWGRAAEGQLGDGVTAMYSLTPVDVSGLASGVIAVAPGSYHTCALTSTGAMKCWGYNGYGQLGRSTGTLTTPGDVTGLGSGVIALPNVLGWDHTCALVTGGGVKCWGRNDTGQLGDNTTTGRTLPTDVSGLTSGVVAVTIGYQHTCVLTSAGEVKCWGDNMHSQLGDGTTTMRKVPTSLSPR